MRKGWEIKKIGDVCVLRSGTTLPPKIEKASGDFPYLKVADMAVEGNELSISTSSRFVNKADVNASNIIPTGSTIFPKRGGAILTNKKRITSVPICMDLNLMAVTPKSDILPQFLYYYFIGLDLRNINNGSSIPQINNYQIEPLNISFPKLLSEQKQIIFILDKAFAAIDKAKQNAEKNLQNARELFESHLQSKVQNIRSKGQLYPLSNYLDLITYGFTNPMPTTDEGPFMVTAKDVKGGIVDYVTSRKTSQHAFDTLLTDKSRPRKGDVLLTKDGTLGRLAVVETANLCINQSVALLRPNKLLDSYYLKQLLSSQLYQRLMIEQAGGATIKHIYITRVDKMLIPVPSIAEQQTIVQQLDILSANTKQLESIYQQKLTNFEELKKSILQKAFSGELASKQIPEPA